MSKTKLALIAFYAPPEMKEKLVAWAKSEDRTLSNLMVRITTQALEKYQLAHEPTKE